MVSPDTDIELYLESIVSGIPRCAFNKTRKKQRETRNNHCDINSLKFKKSDL